MKLSPRFSLSLLISITGFLLLAACGGGEDKETSTKDLQITSENAEKVASLALEITGNDTRTSATANGNESALSLKYKQTLNLISQAQKKSRAREKPQAAMTPRVIQAV
jgi:uncharacterized lipoprotein YajG